MCINFFSRGITYHLSCDTFSSFVELPQFGEIWSHFGEKSTLCFFLLVLRICLFLFMMRTPLGNNSCTFLVRMLFDRQNWHYVMNNVSKDRSAQTAIFIWLSIEIYNCIGIPFFVIGLESSCCSLNQSKANSYPLRLDTCVFPRFKRSKCILEFSLAPCDIFLFFILAVSLTKVHLLPHTILNHHKCYIPQFRREIPSFSW